VYDGDTMTCIFPIFGENYFKFNIRLMGIDTAEMKTNNDILKERAFSARHYILEYLCGDDYNLDNRCSRQEIQEYLKNNEIMVWLECFDFDKYGRILGNIYKKEKKESLSELLIDSKLAYRYDGNKKVKN
jgi:endonuclease YncB( thermonuclease family)